MAELRHEDIIKRPLITEKNTMLMETGQYSFEVATEANKIQIKAAVEATFNVRVKAVNTLNVKKKAKSRAASRRNEPPVTLHAVAGGADRVNRPSRTQSANGWSGPAPAS